MAGYNKITIGGFLSKDAEIRQVGDYKVARLTIPVSKKVKGEERTTWFIAEFWGEKATPLETYATKGTPMIIDGELEMQTYTNKDGVVKTQFIIKGFTFAFMGKGQEKQTTEGTSEVATETATEQDGDLPF